MGAEKHPDDKIQSEGRKDNAAQHVNPGPDNAGAERYPAVKKDDSIDTAAGGERRSFEGVETPASSPEGGAAGSDPSLDQSAAKR